MRLRIGVTLLLVTAVAGCGAGAHHAARPKSQLSSLQRQLKLYLARAQLGPRVPLRPRVIVAPSFPGGGPCFVATRGGPCSLTPCIVYAQGVQGVVLQQGPFAVRPGTLGTGRCPPGARTSQVLRVSGP